MVPFSNSMLFGPHYSALSVTVFQTISNDTQFKCNKDVSHIFLRKTFQTGFSMCLLALPLVYIISTASITSHKKTGLRYVG